jgi:hypothetical protein
LYKVLLSLRITFQHELHYEPRVRIRESASYVVLKLLGLKVCCGATGDYYVRRKRQCRQNDVILHGDVDPSTHHCSHSAMSSWLLMFRENKLFCLAVLQVGILLGTIPPNKNDVLAGGDLICGAGLRHLELLY